MEVGDKVKVVRSPYLSIKNGTIATIIEVKYRQYGDNWTVYVLDTKPSPSTFRPYELEKIEK